jgi:hypothetical protein
MRFWRINSAVNGLAGVFALIARSNHVLATAPHDRSTQKAGLHQTLQMRQDDDSEFILTKSINHLFSWQLCRIAAWQDLLGVEKFFP